MTAELCQQQQPVPRRAAPALLLLLSILIHRYTTPTLHGTPM